MSKTKYRIYTQPSIIPNNIFWNVHIRCGPFQKVIPFSKYEGAIEFVQKKLKRAYKEAAAFSMLNDLSKNLLSFAELQLYTKLKNTNCIGISKNQYGYLKGIHERQKRAW